MSEDEVQRLARRAAGGDAVAARRLADILESRSASTSLPKPTGVWVRFWGREFDTERRFSWRDLPPGVESLTLGPFHNVRIEADAAIADGAVVAWRPMGRGVGYWRVDLEWATRAPELAGVELPDESSILMHADRNRRRHFVFNAQECLSAPNFAKRRGAQEQVEVLLLPSLARGSAELILEGGGATSDRETLEEIVRLARRRGSDVRFVRRDRRGLTHFDLREMEVALESGIELRPSR